MPESKKRKRAVYVPPAAAAAAQRRRKPSPVWLVPLMLAMFGIGIVWLVVFYLSGGDMAGIPGISRLNNGNLLVGFGFIVVGFGLSTQWR